MGGDWEEQMGLKSFKEFMWNKRRNEYLRLKHTAQYRRDPEHWEMIYKDVSDTAVNGLTERDSEAYDCRASRTFGPYRVIRSTRSGQFVRVRA